MIARHWHGKTLTEKADAYEEFLLRIAIPDYTAVDGLLEYRFLRRTEGKETHFDLFTYWTNMETIKKFAGDVAEKAKYYPEDKAYLLEFETNVKHYNVFAKN